MKQFIPLLKSINDRLDLPQPTKSRIILEIAADLNDLYQLYLCRGLNEQQAAQRAEEKFDFTGEALNELTQLHQSLFRRLMDRISEQAQTKWERIALFLVLFFIVAFGSKFIFATQFVLQTSKFILPILGIFLGIIIISLLKSYQLYIKKDHNVKLLHKGLPAILYLGGINIFLGVSGYIIELYSTTRTMMYSGMFDVIVTVFEHGDAVFFNSVERIMKCASMAMVCTLVTILTVLVWFILINKIKRIELAEAAFLLED